MIDFLLMFGVLSFYFCFVVLFTKVWIFCVKWVQVNSDLDTTSLFMISVVPTLILFICSSWYWLAIMKHTTFMF